MTVRHVTRSDVNAYAGTQRPGGLGLRSQAPAEEKGPGAALVLLVLPVLCCGGPLIFGALAAASAATLGVVGGILGAVLLAVAIGLIMRHRRAACCTPTEKAWRP